jgi:predicted ATPase
MTYHLSNFYTITIHTQLHNVYFDHALICAICWFNFMSTSTNLEIDAMNKSILYNLEETQPWVTLYEQKRRKWKSERK